MEYLPSHSPYYQRLDSLPDYSYVPNLNMVLVLQFKCKYKNLNQRQHNQLHPIQRPKHNRLQSIPAQHRELPSLALHPPKKRNLENLQLIRNKNRRALPQLLIFELLPRRELHLFT